jgi:hypothetical protein
MERRVSVNAGTRAAVTPDGLPKGWSEPVGPIRQPSQGDLGDANRGPCLYLGPRGERCGQKQLTAGFCAVHDPDRPYLRTANPVRFWAVAGAIAALLWPYLGFIVREIIGWARSR